MNRLLVARSPYRAALAAMCVVAVLLPGCKGKVEPVPGSEVVVGVWVEKPEDPVIKGARRVQRPPRLFKEMRRIELTAAGAFTLTLAKADGQPLDPAKNMTGAWKYDAGQLTFEVKTNTLGEPYKAWAPTGGNIARLEGQTGGVDLTLYHANNEAVLYKRQ